jgi:hypothetical protein
LPIDSASARLFARIDAPSASPFAFVASASAMPRWLVTRDSDAPICSIAWPSRPPPARPRAPAPRRSRCARRARLLHLVGGRVAGRLRELVAIGDQILDGEPADDRAQVAVEDLAHEVVPQALLGLQEAHAGVGDRALVVADLEDGDPAHADRDLLRVDALDLEQRLVGLHRQVLRLLQHGHHERPAPRIATITSPVRPGRIAPVEVTRPRAPIGESAEDMAALA